MNFYYPTCQQYYHPMDSPVEWCSAPREMVCSICSDKAEGYHFGAISCAACGAFFRRSISDQKVYACSNRQCNIRHDPTKRGGSCRFCRFLKCVTSGMMPQDVRAKRATTQNSASLQRNLNQTSAILVDQIIGLRRNIAADRNGFETTHGPTNRTNLMILLQQEFDHLKRVSSRFPVFMQMIENLNLHVCHSDLKPMEDPIRYMFLVIFIFETCCLTSSKGGVQLDRMFLPNLMFVDLNESLFLEFLQCDPVTRIDSVRNIHNTFSYLVQMVSRTFQSSNFDEHHLAIVFYMILSESVPIAFRNRFSEVNRDGLLADLNRLDASKFQNFNLISGQVHQGAQAFKEIISTFS